MRNLRSPRPGWNLEMWPALIQESKSLLCSLIPESGDGIILYAWVPFYYLPVLRVLPLTPREIEIWILDLAHPLKFCDLEHASYPL